MNMVSSGGSLWFRDWRSETRQYPNTAPHPTTVRLRLRWLVGADVGREHRNRYRDRYRDRTPCEAITKTKHGQPPEETIPIPIAIWRERRLSAWACRGTSERHEIGQPRPAPHNTEKKRETIPNPAPLRTLVRLWLTGSVVADVVHANENKEPIIVLVDPLFGPSSKDDRRDQTDIPLHCVCQNCDNIHRCFFAYSFPVA